jgi:dTDP-4-amino-4,6-dideoxygalactose transaminase
MWEDMSSRDPITVPFVDLTRAHGAIAAELREAFDRVLGASSFILGEELERFEREFAAYCGTAHCVGVSSGTAALEIMLRSAGIGPGDEVIIPAHTFVATALGVLHAGATPVCVDVLPGTGLLDPGAAAAAIGPATAAILPVHLYGQPCQMESLRRLADQNGLLLMEDAAQAHGASHRGRRIGSLGKAAAFSFYPSKNMGALGDAGAICTDDAALALAARRLRDLGRWGERSASVVGRNERLDGLQAAFLRVKLGRVDQWNADRRNIAQVYRTRLSGTVDLLEEPDGACVYHLFPVKVDQRDELAAHLASAGIATGIHYPLCVPEQPAIRPLVEAGRVKTGEFRNSRDWASLELSLPIFPGMREEEIEAVVSAATIFITQNGDALDAPGHACDRRSRMRVGGSA